MLAIVIEYFIKGNIYYNWILVYYYNEPYSRF